VEQERQLAAAQHALQVQDLKEQLASVVAEGQELRQRLAVAEQELQQEQQNAVSLTAVAQQGRETRWRSGQSWGRSWQELRRRWGEGVGAGRDPFSWVIVSWVIDMSGATPSGYGVFAG